MDIGKHENAINLQKYKLINQDDFLF